MAISQLSPSQNSSKSTPYHPSSKLKQRQSTLLKKKLLRKRPMGSLYNPTKKEEIDDMHKPIIRFKKGLQQITSSAVDRASEVQENLPPQFPSFVKYMLKSHVTGGFWLGLPTRFCHTHLPERDVTVFLVDESEKEYETKYLWQKHGLSGGWRGFSIAHKLVEGDVLVFQLIMPCRFKVYIVRVNGLTELDGAISLLNLDFQAKPIAANVTVIRREAGEDVKNVITDKLDYNPDNKDDDLIGEVLGGIKFSESVVEFKDVKDLGSFSILVDGLVIDSQIPMHLRNKYFDLCRSQNAYLHDRLFKGLNCKLVAGIISETVNIADAIRAAKVITSSDDLRIWDKTLKAFEDMGMRVGFLRARIEKLASLETEQLEMMIQLKTGERVRVEEQMRSLETKLVNAKQVLETLDADIKELVSRNEKPMLAFNEMAAAPW